MTDELSAESVSVREVRVLDGPNLYFTRPAVKVSLRLPGYLALEQRYAVRLAACAGLRDPRPGKPGTAQRQRFVMRLAAHVMRRVVAGVGPRRLTVRTRPGGPVDEVVVAIPWRHRTWGRLAGEALGPVLSTLLGEAGTHTESVDRVVAEAAARIRAEEPGGPSPVRVPAVPVVSVTGTNGKTTTTRLLAHLAVTAGRRTGWSSTSGVVVMGETVEAGDFSGPAGARAVLATPGLEVAVLETARGGLLLRGMGVAANDVSVVTNVTADHLGLQGIDTLDQLAEVKAIVTTVTKPDGWVVLNGEDPRVWAMRHRIRARPWAFSVDPDAPALRESVAAGGRGITVLDGELVVLSPGTDPDRLVRVLDVPVTLSGLSRFNTANALAAAAAGLGLGLPRAAVVDGLRTFTPDPVHNEGRLNTYTLPLAGGGRATVILDMAHNEAGLEALLEVARGLRAPGARVHLGIGGTGDRPDEAIEGLGEIAGKGAEHVVIAHKPRYLRGRTLEDLDARLRAGLARVGVVEVESYDTEIEGLLAVVPTLADGDVVAFMSHDARPELQAWLAQQGATPDDVRTVRRKVVAARGEHEFEPEIAALWSADDVDARVAAAAGLVAQHPGDPRLVFEQARAHDAAGEPAAALPLYEAALSAGLTEPQRHRAQIQAAGCLRVLGDYERALRLLEEVEVTHPGNAAVAACRALVRLDAGRPAEAVADLLDALASHAADEDAETYRRGLHESAAGLRQGARARRGEQADELSRPARSTVHDTEPAAPRSAPMTTTHHLETPDATLAYDVQGPLPTADGQPPLVMVGHPMDAGGFRTLASLFPDRTVVTYDPRGLGRSVRTDGRTTHTPEQNAADVHAVIAALGAGPVDVFGSSGGAVTGLALVAAYPQDVRTLVAHEPPLVPLLPDADRAAAAFRAVTEAFEAKGFGAGIAQFVAMTSWRGEFTDEYAAQPPADPAQLGMPAEDDGRRDDPMLSGASQAVSEYRPDVEALRRAPTRVVVACGVESAGTLTGRTSEATAALLGVKCVVFPSHHAGFLGGEYGQRGDPEAFAVRLREVLRL